MNNSTVDTMNTISMEYDLLSSARVVIGQKEKRLLGDSGKYECRFCGLSKPDVKFTSKAHVIPDFMGNKTLFSNYECSTCNNFFSRFETDFANFMLPFNTIAGTISKKNVSPKYKSGAQFEISNDGKTVNISELPLEFFENGKTTFDLKLVLPTYRPDYIYRTLVKIGLALVEKNKLDDFGSSINLLMNEENIFPFNPCMIFSVFPFSYDIGKIDCSIFLRKKEIVRNTPKLILVLSYKNFCFQTFLPVEDDCNIEEEFYPFPFVFPSPLDCIEGIETEKIYLPIMLNSKEKVKGDIIEVTISSKDGIILQEQINAL